MMLASQSFNCDLVLQKLFGIDTPRGVLPRGRERPMNKRFQFRSLSLALCLAVMGAVPLDAEINLMLCIGVTSKNYQPAQFNNCPVGQAAELLSFSLGASNSGNPAIGSPGKVSEMKFTIEHYSDATTRSWAESLLKGPQVASVVVLGINTSSGLTSASNAPNVTIVLANPVVVSVSTNANDGKPIETVTMTYQRVTIVDNTVSPPVTINWME